jgi:tRNA pseudouridine32 synthase/23S rRNA pseudouridine746 synthase
MIDSGPDPELPPYQVPHTRAPIRIVYRDPHLLIVEKPTLLLSVPGRHPLNKDCLIHRLSHRYPGVAAVHRLDLDTSGLMLVPRHGAALSGLARLFQERRIGKTYHARVAGTVDEDQGEIDLPLAPDWPNRPKQKVCFDAGKPALTRWQVLQRDRDSTLLELTPITGRSHQLRIHLQQIGHPILGCDLYAPESALRAAPRLLLHATRLVFEHPIYRQKLTAYSAPSDILAPTT